MKVEIKEKQIELKNTFLSMMLFEQITGEAFNSGNISSIITYFYCVIIASNKDYELPFADFMQWLDENPDKLNEFAEWQLAHNKAQADLKGNNKGNGKNSTKKK